MIFLFSFSQKTIAQNQLLDSLTLDTLMPYTSIDEALKNPELVIKLELRKKKLKVFPHEIFKFTNLQYLDLGKNSIKEIPAEIGQLHDLQYLAISKNDLKNLPPQIGDLSNLYYLNVNQNNLVALPWQMGNLKNLRNIDLWSNNIEKFPSELRGLKSLEVMDLRVILIPDDEQARLKEMLPQAKLYFSPYCKCAQ